MGWKTLIDLTLEHDYYAPNMPPVTVRPADSTSFGRDGLLLRQSGSQIFVLAEDENLDLPNLITLDLVAQNRDVISVTAGADWKVVPQIRFEVGHDSAALDPDTDSDVLQVPRELRLAQIMIVPNHSSKRDLTVQFAAVSSYWAYHVIGPGNEEVIIEDPEGEVVFDPMGTVTLPGGKAAQVIRSRAALPARARPGQRFSLSRPGPFGPRTLIPVLPAPPPQFASVTAPDGASAIIQSDIYVSIF